MHSAVLQWVLKLWQESNMKQMHKGLCLGDKVQKLWATTKRQSAEFHSAVSLLLRTKKDFTNSVKRQQQMRMDQIF